MEACTTCRQYHRIPLYFIGGDPVYSIPRCNGSYQGFPKIGKNCPGYDDKNFIPDWWE